MDPRHPDDRCRPSEAEILAVLGSAGGPDDDLPAMAAASRTRFVRSHAGLSRSDGGTCGLEMTASQALDAFGWDVLSRLAREGEVPVVRAGFEPAAVLPATMRAAGLTAASLAERAGVHVAHVEAAESGSARTPMSVLGRIALALGLCPIRFGAVDSRPAPRAS